MTTVVKTQRFVRKWGTGGTVEVWDVSAPTAQCLLILGPPRGRHLAIRVRDRLNAIGELSMQIYDREPQYPFRKLAMKFLMEESDNG